MKRIGVCIGSLMCAYAGVRPVPEWLCSPACPRSDVAASSIRYWPDGTCAGLLGLGTDARLMRTSTQFSTQFLTFDIDGRRLPFYHVNRWNDLSNDYSNQMGL